MSDFHDYGRKLVFFVSEGSVLQVFVIADRYSNRVSFVSFNSQKQLRQST